MGFAIIGYKTSFVQSTNTGEKDNIHSEYRLANVPITSKYIAHPLENMLNTATRTDIIKEPGDFWLWMWQRYTT